MRAIDADLLLKCIPYEEVISRMAILNVPTIDIKPEIIQCKDCVHSRSDVWLYANRPATVDYYCERTDVHIWPNESCDKAERREEGDK